MNKFKNTLLIFFTSLSAQSAKIGSDHIEWAVLETDHFSIIYDNKQQDLSRYYAQVSEQAYANIKKIFKNLPEKISLVINDSTDISNGNATVFPYPLINVFPVQIGSQDTLSESSEWARELVTHELVHVAQLYPYSGIPYKIARALLGSIVSPNLLTPNWWKEGMAVELETQFSEKGRTRSIMQDAQVRSYVLDKTFKNYDLPQANENLVTFPYGNRPYFFGSLLMNQISLEKGLNSFGLLVDHQSSSPPFFINGSIKQITGLNYSELYEKMQLRYLENSEEQIKILQSKPTSNQKAINNSLIQSKSIKFSEYQNIIGQISTSDLKTEIDFYTFEATLKKWNKLNLKSFPSGSITGFSFHPHQKKIIFSKSRKINSRENFSDLYEYDLTQEKVTELTTSLRARDPIYSPNGQFVLFTELKNGQTNLKQLEIATKKVQPIINLNFNQRLNSYTYLDSNQILYTIRDSVGEQKLYSIQLKSEPKLISQAPKDIRFIVFKSPYLYFNSAQSGVSNIYQSEIKNNELTDSKPISHFMTGALSFDVDPKNSMLFTTLITSNGSATFHSDFQKINELPVIKNKNIFHYKSNSDEKYSTTLELSEYSSWKYLYPRYWIPFASTNTTGDGALYQASTSAGDPLGNHNYALQANYDTKSNKLGYMFNYLNSQLYWDWSISAFEAEQLITIDNYVRKSHLNLSLFPDLFNISEDALLSVGTTLVKTKDDLTNFETEHWGGFIQTIYSTVDQKAHHYYPMTGLNLGLKYQYFTDLKKQINTKYGNYSQVLGSIASYQNLFLPKNHSLSLKLNGLYTFEDVAQRFGVSNLSLPGESDLLNPYNIRGYQAAQFLGTQLVTAQVEYQFPVYDITASKGVVPFYLKYLTAAVVADGLATKGFGYNNNKAYEALNFNQTIYSAGLEARLKTTVGYLLPLQIIGGVYFPFDKKWAKDTAVAGFNIQIGGL